MTSDFRSPTDYTPPVPNHLLIISLGQITGRTWRKSNNVWLALRPHLLWPCFTIWIGFPRRLNFSPGNGKLVGLPAPPPFSRLPLQNLWHGAREYDFGWGRGNARRTPRLNPSPRALCSREEKSECTFRQHLKVEKCYFQCFLGGIGEKKKQTVLFSVFKSASVPHLLLFFFWLFRHTVRKDSQQFLSKKKNHVFLVHLWKKSYSAGGNMWYGK